MDKKVKWSWTSAIIGATAATATGAIILARPKAPKFRLVSLTALSVKFSKSSANEGQDEVKFPRLHADLILNIHVTNPNILPVRYSATSLKIYYDGSLMGSAHVPAGSQPSNSCQLLRLQARLNEKELAQHAKRFLSDLRKRKMIIDAEVDICGWANVILWGPRFKVHVDSHIVVDPVLLDVVDQKNESNLQLFAK